MQVHQDDIKIVTVAKLDGFKTVFGHLDRLYESPETSSKKFAIDFVVIHDQHVQARQQAVI